MAATLDLIFLGPALEPSVSPDGAPAARWAPLLRELRRAGHRALLLERNASSAPPRVPEERDGYGSLDELRERHGGRLRAADLVVVCSGVPEGPALGRLVQRSAAGITALYDPDTARTLAALSHTEAPAVWRALVPGWDLYLSARGGPALARLQHELGAPMVRLLPPAVDPELPRPLEVAPLRALGVVVGAGPVSEALLAERLLGPARARPDWRFAVVGRGWPTLGAWPDNVEHHADVPAASRPAFYATQRCTLALEDGAPSNAGALPEASLFEAAGCGAALLGGVDPGLAAVLAPGREYLVAATAAEVLARLETLREEERRAIGARARARMLSEHTAAHRAEALVRFVAEAREARARRRRRPETPARGQG